MDSSRLPPTQEARHSLGFFMSPDFQDNLVCICHFDGEAGKPIPQSPAVHFQVTLRQENLSRSKKYIRMEQPKGDEIHGWQELILLVLDEKLGILQEDGKTVSVDALENVHGVVRAA